MKYALFAALSVVSVFATADDTSSRADDAIPPAVQYSYSQHLDIAKVISMSNDSNLASVCGPVEAHIVYIDSKGVTHNMGYTRMGDGCQNG